MILLNMDRLGGLLVLGVIVELFSDMEMNPESAKEEDISLCAFVENPKGLEVFARVEGLADTVCTGLFVS